VIFVTAINDAVGRLHGEVDGAAIQSSHAVSQPVWWIEG